MSRSLAFTILAIVATDALARGGHGGGSLGIIFGGVITVLVIIAALLDKKK